MKSENGVVLDIETNIEINLDNEVYSITEAFNYKTAIEKKGAINVNGKPFKVLKVDLISKSNLYLVLVQLDLTDVLGGKNGIEVTW